MIITCPNCQSRYEVAAQALGDRGRKVECANCHANWKALPLPEAVETPVDDQLFSAEQEDELDAFFEAEEARVTDTKPAEYGGDAANEPSSPTQPAADSADTSPASSRLDVDRLARQRRALARRQQILKRNLPQARLRRGFRVAMVVVLMMFIGGGIYLRDPIVRDIPELAALYEAVGLKVNVVGIDFEDVQTLRALRDGHQVLQITANLVNISNRQVSVPQVMVSLLNSEGASIFEWSVMPKAEVMQARDWTEFSTQLTSPPADAAQLRLTFLDGPQGQSN